MYTPEFASVAWGSRTVVTAGSSATIDLIALPGASVINLNGGAGLIDGVAVTVGTGLRNPNAEGSSEPVTLTGLAKGGSELTGGEVSTSISRAGGDTIYAGLGATTIRTGGGGSTITLSSMTPSAVTVTSGGGDRAGQHHGQRDRQGATTSSRKAGPSVSSTAAAPAC